MEIMTALLLFISACAAIIGGGWLGDYIVNSMHEPALVRHVVFRMYLVGTILSITALAVAQGK